MPVYRFGVAGGKIKTSMREKISLARIDKKAVGCKRIYSLSENENSAYIYYYASLDTVKECIKNNNIWFSSPSSWKDKFENYFYEANYSQITNEKDQTPRMAIRCFTTKGNNEAAWSGVYDYSKKSPIVRLKIKKTSMREQIDQWCIDNNATAYIGKVQYFDYGFLYNIPHKDGDSETRKKLFEKFNLRSFLTLMLLKRDMFQHEKELRFMIVPVKYDGQNPIDVPIDWSKVLVEASIKSGQNKIGELKELLQGLNVNVNEIDIYCEDTKPAHIEKLD